MFAILVCEENEFDSTEKPGHTLQVLLCHKRRRCDQDHEGFIPAQARTGVG